MKNNDIYGLVYIEDKQADGSVKKTYHFVPKEVDTRLRKEAKQYSIKSFDAATEEGRKEADLFLYKDA